MIYLRLFLEFFRIGLFSVGGGLATIPFLTELSGKTGWFTLSELADMIAVSESTPGPIGINMSSYVGMTTAGVPGLLCATLGLITPSIIIIFLIARVLEQFRNNPWVDGIFRALRPMSVALIFAAGISVCRIALFSETGGINFLAVAVAVGTFFGATKLKKIHPIGWIAAGAVIGICFM